jgi:class 3 adenylate cyclase/putative methionine-R-sulfoxide reductase with GAF domain
MSSSKPLKVNLKRIMAKKGVASLINGPIKPSEFAVTVLDADGAVIIGNDAADDSAARYAVMAGNQLIGWVLGDDKASLVALTLSNLASSELEIKALGRETLEKYKEITMLYSITEKLAANLDPKEVAQLVVIEGNKLVSADNISVMLVSEETGLLRVFAALGREVKSKTSLKPGEGIAGRVFLTGVAEIVNDVYADSRYVHGANEIKSLMCAPLKTKDKMIGVVNVSSRQPDFYTSGDLKLLSSLALQSATAIENARLFSNLQKALEQEKRARQEQVELNIAYRRFVPHEFLQYLNRLSITDVQLGDQSLMEMTVLFSDIRSFTTLSEKMTPEENFLFINAYLKQMEPIVNTYKGFIDKYIGDAIMALFNTGADDALQAAISMQLKISEYNVRRKRNGYEQMRVGIGLNTGPVILGIVGGHNRMEGTVISDAVNLASRIEDLNKFYGSDLLISDKTYQNLKEPDRYHIRAIGRVKVKGKSEYVTVHEVFDLDSQEIKTAKTHTKKIFETACLLFYNKNSDYVKDTKEAMELFEKCLTINPGDSIARVYIEQCRAVLKYGLQEKKMHEAEVSG